jgi:hypothetical protein
VGLLGRRAVVVDVRLLAVILVFLAGLVLVRVNEVGVVVLVAVVMSAMVEVTQRPARVVVRHVIVVVGVHDGIVPVLLLACLGADRGLLLSSFMVAHVLAPFVSFEAVMSAGGVPPAGQISG